MPNTVTQTILVDGPRHAVVHFYFESDGSGEFANEKILDGKTDLTPIDSPTQLTIEEIWWGNSFYDAKLSTEDLNPNQLWVLPVGVGAHVDFRCFGGIKVPQTLDGTGNLLLSTNGFAPVGSWGTMVVKLRKD